MAATDENVDEYEFEQLGDEEREEDSDSCKMFVSTLKRGQTDALSSHCV